MVVCIILFEFGDLWFTLGVEIFWYLLVCLFVGLFLVFFLFCVDCVW